MKPSAFSAKLKKAQKLWASSKKKAAETAFENLPDGRYLGRLVEATLGESQASGRLQVAMGYKVLEGDQEGEIAREYLGMETEDNLVWFYRRMSQFGLEIEDLTEDLEAELKKLEKEKPTVRFMLSTKGEYQNLKVTKVLDEDDEDVGTDEDDEDEDDTPTPKKGKVKKPADDDEDEEEDDDEEEDGVELRIGMTVEFQHKGKTATGVVKSINDDDTVNVKTDEGKTVKNLDPSEFSIPDADDDAEEEEEEEDEDEDNSTEEDEDEEDEDEPPRSRTAKGSTVRKAKGGVTGKNKR